MKHEALSALLDGECKPDELDRLLDEMERSPELKEAFSRACLARDAAEGVRVRRGQVDLCAGVMAALDQAPGQDNPKVVAFAAPRSPGRFQWRPLAGMAAAAALGAVAVLVVVPQGREGGVAMGPAPGSTLQARLPLPAGAPVDRHLHTVSASQDQIDQDEELRELLMDHSYAADRGMAGTLSAARFAAHTAEYHPQAEGGDQR